MELLAPDEAVRGTLLRLAVEAAEWQYPVAVMVCDVNAEKPRLQQTLLNLGFRPAAYVPGMVFNRTYRPDVVKMIKLCVPWEPGPLELTESGQAYFDVVARLFAPVWRTAVVG